MLTLPSHFDHTTIALMGHAYDEAWRELRMRRRFSTESDEAETRQLLAERVLAAVSDGERDLGRIKELAVRSAERC